MAYSAIISLSPNNGTLGAVRSWLAETEELRLAADTELVDGGHVGRDVEALGPITGVGTPATISDVRSWLGRASTLGLSDDTVLADAADLCVDTPAVRIEHITCSEHVGDSSVPAILVYINEMCADHGA